MPKVSWEEMNDLIHKSKGALTKIAKAELDLKEVKKEIASALDEMQEIVIHQIDNNT